MSISPFHFSVSLRRTLVYEKYFSLGGTLISVMNNIGLSLILELRYPIEEGRVRHEIIYRIINIRYPNNDQYQAKNNRTSSISMSMSLSTASVHVHIFVCVLVRVHALFRVQVRSFSSSLSMSVSVSKSMDMFMLMSMSIFMIM
jgi:hypothetical protein